jgi:hypothetical protein
MKIREIEEGDLAAVTALFAECFPRRRPSYWQRGFENVCLLPRIPGYPRYGCLLENDGMVQAVLLLLSAQFGDGRPRINFSTWCARPAYRPTATLLQARAMKQKAELYLNLSAAEHTVPILEVFGFKPYTAGVCLLDARAAALPDRGWRLTRYDPKKDDGLPAATAIIAARHHRYGCTVLVLDSGSGTAELLIYRRKRIKRILPCAQMLLGTPDRIQAAAGPLMRHLLSRGIPLALVDIIEDIHMVGARTYRGHNLRYAKGAAPAVGDMLDSEFALFGP